MGTSAVLQAKLCPRYRCYCCYGSIRKVPKLQKMVVATQYLLAAWKFVRLALWALTALHPFKPVGQCKGAVLQLQRWLLHVPRSLQASPEAGAASAGGGGRGLGRRESATRATRLRPCIVRPILFGISMFEMAWRCSKTDTTPPLSGGHPAVGPRWGVGANML